MKVHLRRIVRNKDTKEEIIVNSEVRQEDVQCIFKDKYRVLVSLKNGMAIRVDHTQEEMIDLFIK